MTRNLELSRRRYFPQLVIDDIRERWIQVVRIHVSGDFYDVPYTRKWLTVARALPQVKFYAYTRSWREKRFRRALADLAACDNVRLWYSADDETGPPEDVPASVRVAWMMTIEEELPVIEPSAVVFPVHSLRHDVPKKVAGAVVCPADRTETKSTTCAACSLCWR
jgi:hypothetical protein